MIKLTKVKHVINVWTNLIINVINEMVRGLKGKINLAGSY